MSNRAELEHRRDELIARLESIRRDLASGLDADLEEQSQQLENRDTVLEIERVTREELDNVRKELDALGSKDQDT